MSRFNATTPEPELVAAAQKGGGQAFAELVNRHKRLALSLAARFAPSRGEIDDLGQEIFLKAYRELPGFRGESSFATWLWTVAVSCCLDYLRKAKRSPAAGGLELPLELPDDSKISAFEAADMRDSLNQAMAKLSPADRLVITMLELEGESVETVAQAANVSKIGVRVRAHRARGKLRALLEDVYGADS
ncbi:MAG: sigma-70 family RNA polymerase sigma factor [Desulfovibrionaceae bacterium]|nr:sigma-70 family RNA polymerase sigma factor [Desulfovibrionaceae bacterium]MBF0514248.1 sigma-70 family RNA polymerase sigma factor [Desulfovibrionaceae bacterium]